MDWVKIARAFNEWMERFINFPDEFEREWEAVADFMQDVADGMPVPSYGAECAAYLKSLYDAE